MLSGKELLFPAYVIPTLVDKFPGEEWRELVESMADFDETDPELLAFCLTMIRLGGCLDCKTDSAYAIEGCEWCAARTFKRRLGKRNPLKEYEGALLDVNAYLFAKLEEDSAETYPVVL